MHPLTFRPLLKRIVWGGRRLGTLLGKPIGEENDYAESWEIVDHGEDQSVVENGLFSGKTLAELVAEFPGEVFGRQAPPKSFPLLLKFLDCNRVLSVQVHPDDAYGLKMPKPDLGKTEAWYIVAAEPGSCIYAGLKPGVDREALRRAVAEGRAEEVLHRLEPEVGQCIFIPAGTVHALGGGLVVAEIQQSSDTTFRLYDWNRLGDDGRPRPLHLEQALEVTDYDRGPVQPQKPIPCDDGSELLVECDKFVLRRVSLDRQETPFVIGDDRRMHLATVVGGGARLVCGGSSTELPLGRSVMLPAAAPAAALQATVPKTTVLTVHLP